MAAQSTLARYLMLALVLGELGGTATLRLPGDLDEIFDPKQRDEVARQIDCEDVGDGAELAGRVSDADGVADGGLVREAAGPVTVRAVGEVLGLPCGASWSRCGRS